MANHPPYNYLDIGIAGEDLVAQWLQTQGWEILHRRWRCRWGEIDIIAQYDGETSGVGQCPMPNSQCPIPNAQFPMPNAQCPIPNSPLLAFVEVKTRSPGNWDAGGRDAIAPQKQAKISRAAQMFLVKYPEKADYLCRFDVAIVCCQQILTEVAGVTNIEKYDTSSSAARYQFTLQEYIPAAFESLNDNG